MGEAVNYIILAVPVFFLLIGIEVLVDKLRKTGYYRFDDALTNINCGLVEQSSGAFLVTALMLGYLFLYREFRIFTIPSNVWTFALLFVGVDFFYYWFHRYAHEINLLWGGHVVHHQSEEYNLSVALRQGAFQKLSSWIFYLPLGLAGFDPIMFLVVNQFQTLYQFWIHTRHINKLPAAFEYVFNTPSHHRVHHGRNPKYIDRNHGGTLIIWDRMFGTFQKEEESVVYGITKPLNSWNPVWAQLAFWRDLFYDMGRARGLGHKLGLLIHEPGWRPAEMGGPQRAPDVSPATEVKFGTGGIPLGLNYYVLFQFIAVTAGASAFMYFFDEFSHPLQLGLTALLFFSVISMSAIFEKHRWVWWTEPLRLIMVLSTALWLLYGSVLPVVLFGAASIFLLLSILWFHAHKVVFKPTV